MSVPFAGQLQPVRRLFVQIEPILKFNGLSVITNDVVEASEYPRDRRHIALEKDRHLPSEVTPVLNAPFRLTKKPE